VSGEVVVVTLVTVIAFAWGWRARGTYDAATRREAEQRAHAVQQLWREVHARRAG